VTQENDPLKGYRGLARERLAAHGLDARLWVGDATAISSADERYDAVFDFGIVHHVPDWRPVLSEVSRVLVPGGRFYAEEVLAGFITHPITRRVLEHPQSDRFERKDFLSALAEAGLVPIASEELWHGFAWFVAAKPLARGSVEFPAAPGEPRADR